LPDPVASGPAPSRDLSSSAASDSVLPDPAAAGPERSGLFARGIWRLAAANVTDGNRVRLLHDGPATFDTMVAAIEEARDRVALESYIIRDDGVGRRFAGVLEEAAARGVHVRVLADWIGSRGT